MAGETPKLWSKLESAGDVTSPQLGTGGAEIGSPTYVAAKFNNGILSDVDNEGCTFPTAANSINLDKGTVEVWMKMNFAQDDSGFHQIWDFWSSSDGGIKIFFHPSLDDFRCQVMVGGVDVLTIDTTDLTFAVDSLHHLAVTWDRAGNAIGDSKTLVVYWDNVEEISSTTTWNTDSVNSNLYVGQAATLSWHADAVIDNIKTFDLCKIDFSDKETEGEEEEEAEPTIFFSHNF